MNKIELFFTNQFKFILVVLAIVKLWLVMGVSVTAMGGAYHDDHLFINLANSFLEFLSGDHEKWLGNYHQMTLAKGPIYPLFLAVNFMIGLPLLFTESLLYVIAGALLVLLLKKLINQSVILIFLYAVYIFNPEIVTRIMREGIYPALMIFVISGLVAIYIYRESSKYKLALWAIFLGVMLSFFWMTREEGILIIPSFFLIESYILFLLYRQFKVSKEFFKRVVLCLLLPITIFFGNTQFISLFNKIYYGTQTIVELKSNSFLSAYGALSRVMHPHFKRYIPVPKEVRHTIYAVSPSFKELEQFLEGKLQFWGFNSCQFLACGEIAGGWFVWALRDAVAMAGYYKSGTTAEEFYLKVAYEINSACDKKLLMCESQRATMASPFRQEYTPLLVDAFMEGFNTLISFKGLSLEVNTSAKSSGSSDNLLIPFRDLTRNKIAPLELAPPPSITINGWAFTPTEEVHLRIQSTHPQKTEKIPPLSFKKGGGSDVYEYFLKLSQQYENAKNSRFSITSSCIKNCELVFYTESTDLATINLEKTEGKILSNLPFHFNIDTITKSEPSPLSRQHQLDVKKISLLQNIASVYYMAVPWLSYLGLGLFLVSVIKAFMARQLGFILVLNSAILSAIIFRLLALSYIHVTSFPSINALYFAPLYPLLLIFIILAIIGAMTNFFVIYGEKNE